MLILINKKGVQRNRFGVESFAILNGLMFDSILQICQHCNLSPGRALIMIDEESTRIPYDKIYSDKIYSPLQKFFTFFNSHHQQFKESIVGH